MCFNNFAYAEVYPIFSYLANSLILCLYIYIYMYTYLCSPDGNLIEVLEEMATSTFEKTGFFHAGPELCCHQLNPHEQ